MQCTNCGKPAKQSTVEIGGKKTAVCLCSDCLRRLYRTEKAPEDEKSCSACGTTLADFRRTGLLGCAECYRVFREELLSAVRSVQGGLRHEGKEPVVAAREDYTAVFVREGIKTELERALRDGKYDEAKQLSEELRELKKKTVPEDSQ